MGARRNPSDVPRVVSACFPPWTSSHPGGSHARERSVMSGICSRFGARIPAFGDWPRAAEKNRERVSAQDSGTLHPFGPPSCVGDAFGLEASRDPMRFWEILQTGHRRDRCASLEEYGFSGAGAPAPRSFQLLSVEGVRPRSIGPGKEQENCPRT